MITLPDSDLQRMIQVMGEACEQCNGHGEVELKSGPPFECPLCYGVGMKLTKLSPARLEEQPLQSAFKGIPREFRVGVVSDDGLLVPFYCKAAGILSVRPLPLPLGRHLVAEEWFYDEYETPTIMPAVTEDDKLLVEIFGQQEPAFTMPESLARYALNVVDVGEVVTRNTYDKGTNPITVGKEWIQRNALGGLEEIEK